MSAAPKISFQTLPHWLVPFRFFLAAPLFGLLAGFYLCIGGLEVFSGGVSTLWHNRWQTDLIATLHLITLGVISMVMCGALLQLLSVAGKKEIPAVRRGAGIIQWCLCAGGGLFFVGMVFQHWLTDYLPYFYGVSVFFLVAALAGLVLIAGHAILRATTKPPMVRGMAWALGALLIGVVLGGGLMFSYTPDTMSGLGREWTVVHVSWVLAGWVGILVISVSFQVLPMLFLTPGFHSFVMNRLPALIFLCLVLVTLSVYLSLPMGYIHGLLWFLKGLYAAFALGVLWLIQQQKRSTDRISERYWRVAACVYLLFFFWQIMIALDVISSHENRDVISGVLVVYGVILTIILGMLNKIIPFLSFLHMQRACIRRGLPVNTIPAMPMIIQYPDSRRLFYFHGLNLALLLLVVFVPQLTFLVGLFVMWEFTYLFSIIGRVTQMIRKAESS